MLQEASSGKNVLVQLLDIFDLLLCMPSDIRKANDFGKQTSQGRSSASSTLFDHNKKQKRSNYV